MDEIKMEKRKYQKICCKRDGSMQISTATYVLKKGGEAVSENSSYRADRNATDKRFKKCGKSMLTSGHASGMIEKHCPTDDGDTIIYEETDSDSDEIESRSSSSSDDVEKDSSSKYLVLRDVAEGEKELTLSSDSSGFVFFSQPSITHFTVEEEDKEYTEDTKYPIENRGMIKEIKNEDETKHREEDTKSEVKADSTNPNSKFSYNNSIYKYRNSDSEIDNLGYELYSSTHNPRYNDISSKFSSAPNPKYNDTGSNFSSTPNSDRKYDTDLYSRSRKFLDKDEEKEDFYRMNSRISGKAYSGSNRRPDERGHEGIEIIMKFLLILLLIVLIIIGGISLCKFIFNS